MSQKKTKQTRRWINTETVWQWDAELEQYVEVSTDGYWYEGPMALAHNQAATDQFGFQFYDTANSTSEAAQNATPSLDVDTTYVLRLGVENTGDVAETTQTYQLQYQNTTKATGWQNVTGASSHVRFADATGLTNDGTVATGSLTLTGAATGTTAIAGTQCEDGLTASFTLGSTGGKGDYTEFWFAFTIQSADVDNADSIQLRVTGSTEGVLDSYTQTPTITVVEAVVNPGTAAFTGAGTVSATGQHIQTYAGTSSFTGAGTFTGVGAYVPGATTYPGTASFTGAGTLAAVGSDTIAATASFTGAGTLAASGSVVYSSTASFTGAGTFAGVGQLIGTYPGTADFTGAGSLVTTPNTQYGGNASFTGAGTFSGVGQLIGTFPGTASFTGGSSLVATGATTVGATASFTGAGSFSAIGDHIIVYDGVASFSGTGTTSAAGRVIYAATATFTGGSSLVATGQHKGTIPATATFAGSGSFVGNGNAIYPATATFDASSSFSGVGGTPPPVSDVQMAYIIAQLKAEGFITFGDHESWVH